MSQGGCCLRLRGCCKDLCLIVTVWTDDGGDIVVGNSQSSGKFVFVTSSENSSCAAVKY